MEILFLILGGLAVVAFLGGLVGAWAARRNLLPGAHGAERPEAVGQRIARMEAALDELSVALRDATRRITLLEGGMRADRGAPAPVESQAPVSADTVPLAGASRISIPDQPGSLPWGEESRSTSPPPRETHRAATILETMPTAIWQWLVGGKAVVRVGAVVLFFGVAFLLKYAYEHARVPIEVRLLGAALGAVVLLGVGWRLRERRAMYALSLQGCGIGILYLTVFAAFRVYTLLPSVYALTLLCCIAFLSAALAVLQNTLAMAVLGSGGGFLAPILTSTGGGSHVLLFSYYALLNGGIVGMAWFRRWPLLTLLGFGFTFGIGTLWGFEYYQPRHFATTEPFLLLFFVGYAVVPVLFLRRPIDDAPRAIHGTLVFGVPLVAFGLQAGLVADSSIGLAYSALGFGAFYLIMARMLLSRREPRWRVLVEAFLAIGVVFGTLAVPFGLGGRWTGGVWALEGAGLLWLGVRQDRRAARIFGLCLQLGAGLAFLASMDGPRSGPFLLNPVFFGCLFLGLAGLFSNWYLERHRTGLPTAEAGSVALPFCWGLAWWAGGGLHEIHAHLARETVPEATLLFFVGSCVLCALAERALAWPLARYPALALPPLLAVCLALSADVHSHPLARIGWLAWPVGFVAHAWLLRRREGQITPYVTGLHAAGVWLVAGVLSWEAAWVAQRTIGGGEAWSHAAWAIVPGLLLMLLDRVDAEAPWPFGPHHRAYRAFGGAPLAGGLLLWVGATTILSSGNARPLPYVPVLNPLDLAQGGALVVCAWWVRGLRRSAVVAPTSGQIRWAVAALGVAAFAVLSGSALRTVHHWSGVAFTAHALFRSMLVQAVLSILWSALALGSMASATRFALRPLWLAGAGLMGVVVLKLFLIDLSNAGGVERIVSFIGVGVLMLIIGYLSPVPPRDPEKTP